MLLKEKFNRNFKSYVFIFLTLHGDTFGFWFSRLLVLHLVSIASLTFKSIDTLSPSPHYGYVMIIHGTQYMRESVYILLDFMILSN